MLSCIWRDRLDMRYSESLSVIPSPTLTLDIRYPKAICFSGIPDSLSREFIWSRHSRHSLSGVHLVCASDESLLTTCGDDGKQNVIPDIRYQAQSWFLSPHGCP